MASIRETFDYYKLMRKRKNVMLKEEFEKFLIRICYEIRGKIYLRNGEEEQLIELLNQVVEYHLDNFQLYLAYLETNYLKKSFESQIEGNNKMPRKRTLSNDQLTNPQSNEEHPTEADLKEIYKKLD